MLGETFANPGFLWLLLLIPALGYLFWRRRRRMVTELRFSSLQPFSSIRAAGSRQRTESDHQSAPCQQGAD